ncbi:cytochrome P450 [Atractiella rhizophila]|nr:cytochrome P450 [Atractiella rhizophila]
MSIRSSPIGVPAQTAHPFFAPKSWSSVDVGMSKNAVVTSVLALVVSLLVLEQIVYRNKKGILPGAKWTIPVIGKFADSLNPTIHNYKKSWEKPLFAVSVFNIFIVIASSVDYTRKILHASSHAEPCLTASAKKVLLADNWVFLNGKAHAEYRKGLNVLFTRTALESYMPTLEGVFRSYFNRWLADKDGPKPYAMEFRDLNMEVSLKIFCGRYIDDEAGKLIAKNYYLISTALELVNFPLAIPGTKIYNAIQARKLAMKWFMKTAAESKVRMAAGEEPDCLVDRWVKAMIDAREYEAAKKAGREAGESYMSSESRAALIREFSDKEIGILIVSVVSLPN